MKNFVQKGENVDVVLAGTVAVGDLVLIGSLFGIASVSGVSGDTIALATGGVWDIPKTTGQAWTQGVKIYRDASTGAATTTSSGNTLIGVAAQAQLSGDAIGRVRLNDSF